MTSKSASVAAKSGPAARRKLSVKAAASKSRATARITTTRAKEAAKKSERLERARLGRLNSALRRRGLAPDGEPLADVGARDGVRPDDRPLHESVRSSPAIAVMDPGAHLGDDPTVQYIRPQPGKQTMFMECPADICIFGGAGGASKTFGLLLEAARNLSVPGFGAVIFRRTTPQITNEGGLWDESFNLFPQIGGVPREQFHDWKFPSGAAVSFAHMEHLKNRFDWKGAQIPLIGFDQLEDFEEEQFWYMWSRNRSVCGVHPYIRATANPDPDSFVAKLIEWWIDQNTGLPIESRCGVIRWLVRMGGELAWGDTRQELIDRFVALGVAADEVQPVSFTFINAKLSDNKILMAKDPMYRAKLLALPTVERERLLNGNWIIRDGGKIEFKWFKFIPEGEFREMFSGATRLRWSDVAASDEERSDFTSSTRMSYAHGKLGIEHNWRAQKTTGERDKMLYALAQMDAALYDNSVEQCTAQDPGAAGKSQAEAWMRMMAEFPAHVESESGDKLTRSGPWRAQAEFGNVYVLDTPENRLFIRAVCGFPKHGADDVDTLSGGYNRLVGHGSIQWWKKRPALAAARTRWFTELGGTDRDARESSGGDDDDEGLTWERWRAARGSA